jgi:hypothetical protein
MSFSLHIIPTWVIILAVCSLLYISYIAWFKLGFIKEGMEDGLDTDTQNGIGGNSEDFASLIHDKVIHLQDSLLTSKYADNYESAIISIDELVDNLMLKTVLSIDPSSPHKQLESLNLLHNTKQSLNSVMKFIASK